MTGTLHTMAGVLEGFQDAPLHEQQMALRYARFEWAEINSLFDTALAIARSRSLNLVAAE